MSNTKVVGYIRVSTEQQADGGVSLAAQRRKLAAYAEAMDLDLVAIHEDAGASAKSLDRPGITAALADLDAGRADGLLIAKLDRLTRKVADLGNLLDRYFASRCALLSVADSIDTRTAAGRMVLNILTSVAQWEREAVGERTADALAHLKAQGVQLGADAIGWRRTGEKDEHGRRVIERVDSEAEAIDLIQSLRADGLSLRAICERLEADGYPTKRGGKWSAKVVRSVLMRAAA